jgi:putative amide transporter protein
VNLAGFQADGIGWYSLWVAALATGFGLTTILRFNDTPTGLLWLQWAVLWGLFFVVLALHVERLTPAAGWLTLILSFTTCTIPGFLLLLGDWGKIPTWAVVASIVATAVVVIVVAARTVPARAQTPTAASDLKVAIPN